MSLVINESTSHQPLYLQIKDVLKRKILTGEYKPHERLPSESELMTTFKVSRITVRQALRDLQTEGLVFTSQGKGTFASKPKVAQDVQHLEGFAEAMSAKGYVATARVVSIREITPRKDVQDNLNISAGEGVVEVVRVRYLNREPISVDTSYFPIDIGKRLFTRDLGADIFPMLENELGILLGRAEISLEARPCDANVAKLLNMEAGSPLMWVQRLTRDINERPIDYEYLAIRGDSYKYRFEILRERSSRTPTNGE